MKESKIPKFRRCVLQNFPFIEEDFDALTDYELLCKVVEYLNKVIDSQNDVVAKTDDLIAGFEELKSYVDNYFENLDVQEEINNKLEEMAEGGELAGIIAQFLEIAPVFGYGTIAEMAASDNLSNGCIARVLGNTSATAGDGAFYSIRTRIESDDPDGVNLVAIGETLVGVRIQDAAINNLQDQIDELVEPVKKYLFVGDSYAQGYTPDGGSTPWITYIKNKLNLNDSQIVIARNGGCRFDSTNTNNFYNLISELENDENITDIIIGGGYNDYGANATNIATGISDVRTLCKTKFPNAKLHIAFIGWTTNATIKTALSKTYTYYREGCVDYPDIDFMKNTQYVLHRYFSYFSSDGIHPNNSGQNAIANAIVECLEYGIANISYVDPFYFTPTTGTLSSISMTTYLNNETTELFINGYWYLNYGSDSENWITLDGSDDIEIGTITAGNIVGSLSDGVSTTTLAVLEIDTTNSTAPHDGKYVTIPIKFKISDGKIYLNAFIVDDSGSSFGTYIVKRIQFSGFNITVNSMLS